MIDHEILTRAEQILAAGPVKKPWEHGPFCPWCAIADAKGALEHERDLPCDAYDGALALARMALGTQTARVFSQSEALVHVREARR